MPATEKIEKASKLVSLVYAAAVGAAQLLVASGGPGKPTHFAVYLISQTWLEVAVLAIGYAAFRIFKSLATRFRATAAGAGGQYLAPWVYLKRPRFAVPLVLSLFSAAFLCIPMYYLGKSRLYFWTRLSRKSYVETYKLRIDALAGTGRVKDAYVLARVVADTVGLSSEAEYVGTRLALLQAACARSDQLTGQQFTGPWNPVTQREAYTELVEAVRLNPQNYIAADRLKEKLRLLDGKYLKVDAEAICRSEDLRTYRGWAVSLLEATVRRLEGGPQMDCGRLLLGLRNAWGVDKAECLLRWSDSTRMPMGDDEKGPKGPGCKDVETGWEVKTRTASMPEGGMHYPTILDLFRSKHTRRARAVSRDP
ncbi:MAG: hypothetical protein M3O35_02650 [Acidobacteriota bacterium]|nr:hypothetical protein [Acidobacteriota bacterium]